MKNIIWLVSYPKSGNTWFRMFLANYLNNSECPMSIKDIEPAFISSDTTDFEQVTGLNPFELSFEEVDLYRPDVYRVVSQEAKNNGKVCYKKTHDAYTLNVNNEPIFPDDVSISSIYLIRMSLDVCVSYANHSGGEVDKSVEFILNERAAIAGRKSGQMRQVLMSWKKHVLSWKNQSLIPVHFIKYEDMLLNPVETFGSAIRFLELEYDRERLIRSILHSDFKLLQQMENEDGFDERLQSCKQFFWKGKAGNYRDFLTQEQIDRIVSYSYDVMKEFGYIDAEGNLTV